MFEDIPFDVMDPDDNKEAWALMYQEGSEGQNNLNASAANYYLGRIKQNKEKAEQYKNQAKEMKDDFKVRVDTWLQSRQNALDYDTQHCLEMLEAYYEAHKPANGKSISLPEGNIGMYTVSAKYDFDTYKDKVVKFLQEHQLTQYIRNKPEVNKTEIKKAVREVDGKLYVDGIELSDVPYTPKTTAFGIR